MPLYQPENLYAPILTQFSLNGKIAVVTGGSRGIGAEVVRGLAEAGADVAFIYKTNTEADETAARIAKETGVRVQAYRSDVTSRDTIAKTINQIASEFGGGRIDIAVANAGVCANVKSLEYTERTWQDMNSVNYDGVMWTAQAVGNIFKKQGRGNLVITASVSAILVNVPQEQAAYNASKAAVVQLAKSLSVEWANFARVNCVSPGYILTESQLWFFFPQVLYLAPKPRAVLLTVFLAVLTKQPKELMEHWLSMIPGGRVCHPAELRGVSEQSPEPALHDTWTALINVLLDR
ncbi:L-xylulose reductase [Colletotrichum acutatum]